MKRLIQDLLVVVTVVCLALFVTGCTQEAKKASQANGTANGNGSETAKPDLGEPGSAEDLTKKPEASDEEAKQETKQAPAETTAPPEKTDPTPKQITKPAPEEKADADSETKSESPKAETPAVSKETDGTLVDDSTDDADEEDQK